MENIYKKFYQFGLNNEHNFGIFIDSANKYGKNNQMQEYKPNNLRRSPNNGGDVSYMKNQMNTLKSENFDRNMTMKNKEETNNKIPNKFYFSEFDNTHLPKVSSISQPNNNSTIRSQPEVDLKLQQLQLKMQNMEKQHNDDKQILLDIINHNILNIKPYENPNILNNLKSSAQQNNGFGKSNNQKFMETNQDYYVNEDGEVDNKKTIKGLNVDETKVALKRLKDLKEDLGKRIDDEELRGYNQRSELEADMKVIHSELMSKFERLENTRKMNMERIAYILEHSGSSRVKNMSKRLFGGFIPDRKLMYDDYMGLDKNEGKKNNGYDYDDDDDIKNRIEDVDKNIGRSRTKDNYNDLQQLPQIEKSSSSSNNEINNNDSENES